MEKVLVSLSYNVSDCVCCLEAIIGVAIVAAYVIIRKDPIATSPMAIIVPRIVIALEFFAKINR